MKEYTTKEIQEVILTIIKDIDVFCKENDITYYLMSGSALGAMRHKGFIPWDDDLDIFMTVDNYHKFLKLFAEKGDNEKYFLQHENTPEWPLFMSRVCLNGTTMISDEFKFNLKQHHTVFVDIMCLYSAPANSVAHRIQYISAQLLRVNSLAKCNFPNKNIVKRIALGLSKIIVNKFTKPLLIKAVHKYEGKNTELMGHYFGRARYKNTSFPRKYLGKARYVPFEDTELPVFEYVEEYLESRFGSKWMEIPDQKTRDKYPVHGNFVDLENDYTKYLNADKTEWSSAINN